MQACSFERKRYKRATAISVDILQGSETGRVQNFCFACECQGYLLPESATGCHTRASYTNEFWAS
jgi:hypothetical protein